ncbi:hypothetical protein IW262DRAFT_1418415 [Armillaria fumosa]|nr:hypothetical protein IW262DRAFT_1418415 [Armillaria fumosa]
MVLFLDSATESVLISFASHIILYVPCAFIAIYILVIHPQLFLHTSHLDHRSHSNPNVLRFELQARYLSYTPFEVSRTLARLGMCLFTVANSVYLWHSVK